MSQAQTMADLTSKKGWVRIKYDQSVWIPILPEYPDGDDWHGHIPCHLAFAHLPDPRHDGGALYAALRYAWRSEEFETDLVLNATAEDLSRLNRAIDDIEDWLS